MCTRILLCHLPSLSESLDGPEPWASGKITDRASLEAVLPRPVTAHLTLAAAVPKLSRRCEQASESRSHRASSLPSSLKSYVLESYRSFSGTRFPHDPFHAFNASLKEIKGVHIIDFPLCYNRLF